MTADKHRLIRPRDPSACSARQPTIDVPAYRPNVAPPCPIYRVDAQTTTAHRITWFALGNEVLDPFAWTDDGSIYFGALAALANRPMLWRVPASGGTATVASTLPFEPDRWSCSISSDGKRWVGTVSHPISDIFLLRDFDPDRR